MEIKFYFAPQCPWCEKAKAWLKKKKLPFEALDLSESDNARDEVLQKSGQLATPVIDIDGQIIVGYNEKALESAITGKSRGK